MLTSQLALRVAEWQGDRERRERVKEDETCVSCRYVPAEGSLIKRDIGSLHLPTRLSFCWSWDVEGFASSHLTKRKSCSWWSGPKTHTFLGKVCTHSCTCTVSAAYSSLSALQYITDDSSTPPTPLYCPEGWRKCYRTSPYLSRHAVWQPAREL